MDAKTYTVEQARMLAETIQAWCAKRMFIAAQCGEPVDIDEERIEAASWRAYADMKEAMEEIAKCAAPELGCGHTSMDDCLDAIEAIARRFVKGGGELG